MHSVKLTAFSNVWIVLDLKRRMLWPRPLRSLFAECRRRRADKAPRGPLKEKRENQLLPEKGFPRKRAGKGDFIHEGTLTNAPVPKDAKPTLSTPKNSRWIHICSPFLSVYFYDLRPIFAVDSLRKK